jgi:hypothetical protein
MPLGEQSLAQAVTHVPFWQIFPAKHFESSSAQTVPAKLQTLHPETEFGMQIPVNKGKSPLTTPPPETWVL